MFIKILKYWNTLRYLKPSQLYWQLFYRIIKPSVSQKKIDTTLREKFSPWVPAIKHDETFFKNDTATFLNQSHFVKTKTIWNDDSIEKLWLYHLHYFDALQASSTKQQTLCHDLLNRWITENPLLQGNGWEPYPTSLRIVNMVKYTLEGHTLTNTILRSLYLQARCLRKRLEYHLLGNHLLANAKALIFAGLFFNTAESEHWLQKGLRILRQQISIQVLTDGGHFELSPMYHAIILEDFLDIMNVLQTYKLPIPSTLTHAIEQMRNWLNIMTHPDGRIAFFNDATFDIAPTSSQLDQYAQRLNLPALPLKTTEGIHLQDSGYIRLSLDQCYLILDVGKIGPDYLPGHAHADTLSFELSLHGKRTFVNSGISCYGTGPERNIQRGTAAHNTVVVQGKNSSEVWKGFRVARRAKPFGLTIEQLDCGWKIQCSHTGYWRLRPRITHSRTWTITEHQLLIQDTVTPKTSACSYLHLHPDFNCKNTGSRYQCGKASIKFNSQSTKITSNSYYPAFGKTQKNQCLETPFAHTLETLIEW